MIDFVSIIVIGQESKVMHGCIFCVHDYDWLGVHDCGWLGNYGLGGLENALARALAERIKVLQS